MLRLAVVGLGYGRPSSARVRAALSDTELVTACGAFSEKRLARTAAECDELFALATKRAA